MENTSLRSLLFLSLCSMGSALSCFQCNTANDATCARTGCSVDHDVCINVTIAATGEVMRRCWLDQRCESTDVQAEFGKGKDISFICCNWDLCNSRTSRTIRTDVNLFLLGFLAASAGLHLIWF
ncbi:CD59 glycoprotein-like [Scyliorhinus canicula]|uniref:CD59 glycoprotein-like n=1 Tax=Scyliorhinus canicula TaxID=7830 RepID=UPI0018F51026|nr:CD59 glycoprotein-like [Scyliorhinus canicula]XP_038663284.1 CD59 glycoprotein-like [Scyliorhinus canicula]